MKRSDCIPSEYVYVGWTLPCDVRIPPATTIRAGCKLETLITALELDGRPSTFAEPIRAASLLRMWRDLVIEGGVPRYTVLPGAALNTLVTMTDRFLASAIEAGTDETPQAAQPEGQERDPKGDAQ